MNCPQNCVENFQKEVFFASKYAQCRHENLFLYYFSLIAVDNAGPGGNNPQKKPSFSNEKL